MQLVKHGFVLCEENTGSRQPRICFKRQHPEVDPAVPSTRGARLLPSQCHPPLLKHCKGVCSCWGGQGRGDGARHRAPGKGSAELPTPGAPAIPSNHLAARLMSAQPGRELNPECVTGCSISPAPPEEISLKDGEKIGDLMLV